MSSDDPATEYKSDTALSGCGAEQAVASVPLSITGGLERLTMLLAHLQVL